MTVYIKLDVKIGFDCRKAIVEEYTNAQRADKNNTTIHLILSLQIASVVQSVYDLDGIFFRFNRINPYNTI